VGKKHWEIQGGGSIVMWATIDGLILNWSKTVYLWSIRSDQRFLLTKYGGGEVDVARYGNGRSGTNVSV